MIKRLIEFLLSCFGKGNSRTQKLKRNTVWIFIIRYSSYLIELVKVPILLSYLDNERYGIWLTIVSIVMWTHQFDFGLGTGLRYKFTESLTLGTKERGKALISTAYVSMTVIMLGVFVILVPICAFINWNDVLNAISLSKSELFWSVFSVLAIFVFRFIVELISIVLKADQRAAISNLMLPIGTILSLVCILILKLFSHNSLLLASIAMALPYALVLLFANIYFFSKDYKEYIPSIHCYDKSLLKEIYSLGLKGFFGQLAALFVFTTANFLVSNVMSPSDVTTYNVARQYYLLPVTFITTITIPMVAAITEAYVSDDYGWIRKLMKKFAYIMILAISVMICMLAVSSFAFHLWVGDKVIVPLLLSIVFTIDGIFTIWATPYVEFLGGVGKLSFRVYLSIFKIITFIPIAVFLLRQIGLPGLVIATFAINTLPNLVFGFIQYYLIINKKAKGIWNK